MTPCPGEAALSRYHDKELEATELSSVRAHLAECQLCSAHVRALQNLDDRILTALSAKASGRPGQRRPFRKLLAAAALFLLLGGLALAGLGGRVAKPVTPAMAEVRREYGMVTPSGATYQIKTRGEVQMLSLEIDGAVKHFETEEKKVTP